VVVGGTAVGLATAVAGLELTVAALVAGTPGATGVGLAGAAGARLHAHSRMVATRSLAGKEERRSIHSISRKGIADG
jgi:hypothetical protein